VAACPGVIEAIVYGVPVAGTEGRAGMAAVTVTPEFDMTALRQHLAQHLPEYARPLFVRICPNIETTGTFKPNKQRLVREGYNPSLLTEPVYFYDRAAGEFTMLDAALYDRILQGDVRA
jgi:fatty-acyl-CoA synthase